MKRSKLLYILGMSLYNYQNGYTVCGVLSSFNPSVYSRGAEQPGYVFLPSEFDYYVGHCYIKCYSGKEEEVTQWVYQILRDVLPESIDPEVSTFLEDINEEQALETKLKDIILFFSVVSLIITLLGVYVAITLDTERRQKEVAIRKVNWDETDHYVICPIIHVAFNNNCYISIPCHMYYSSDVEGNVSGIFQLWNPILEWYICRSNFIDCNNSSLPDIEDCPS